jgi:hypothetical protein
MCPGQVLGVRMGMLGLALLGYDAPLDNRNIKKVVVVAEIDRLLARPAVGVIGLLTHHLEMGLDDMARLRQVFAHIDRVGGCRWASPRHLFPSG